MTPAEFKTAHEALGLSAEFLSDRLGIHVNRIWAYEHHERRAPVPDHAAEAMRDLLNDFECAVERIASESEGPEVESLPRYVKLERFHAAVPELAGWPLLSQSLLLAEVQRRLPSLPVEYVRAGVA